MVAITPYHPYPSALPFRLLEVVRLIEHKEVEGFVASYCQLGKKQVVRVRVGDDIMVIDAKELERVNK